MPLANTARYELILQNFYMDSLERLRPLLGEVQFPYSSRIVSDMGAPKISSELFRAEILSIELP